MDSLSAPSPPAAHAIEPLSPLNIDVADHGSGRCLRLIGELDLSTAPILHERIADQLGDGHAVTLDLTGVPFVDSSGLRVLILAAREAAEHGLEFALLEPLPAQMARLLDVAGLTGRLATRPSSVPPTAAA